MLRLFWSARQVKRVRFRFGISHNIHLCTNTGKDRKDLSLDHDADKLIRTLAGEVGDSTRIVVLIQAPGAVIITPWIDLVDACAIMFSETKTGDAWRNVVSVNTIQLDVAVNATQIRIRHDSSRDWTCCDLR